MDKKVLETLFGMISDDKIVKIENFAKLKTKHITLALENLYQEHNASAVIRTCEALGIHDVHIIEKDNEYQIQRDIARGAAQWMNLYNYSGDSPTTDSINHLKRNGYKIVATSPHAEDFTPENIPLNQPIALYFGTEMDGISEEVKNNADYFLKIPMYGFTESLNISVSAGILINELRNRLTNSDIPFLCTDEQQLSTKISWCTKIIHEGEKIEKEIRKRIIEKKK